MENKSKSKLEETALSATQKGMSYGNYMNTVLREQQNEPKKIRICKICGRGIEKCSSSAKYCRFCASYLKFIKKNKHSIDNGKGDFGL